MSSFGTYDAVVSADGKADYTLISAALADSKLSIFVRPGTYNETVDLALLAGARLDGTSPETTIIDFGANSASLVCNSGYGSVEAKGTIEVVSGTANVVGTDTTFTNLSPGDYIAIANYTFPIATITDDTHLTLATNYNGASESGIPYKALEMVSYVRVSGLTVRNSATAGIAFSGCRRFRIHDVTVQTCTPNWVFNDCSEGVTRDWFSENGNGVGVVLNSVESCTFATGFCVNNISHGMATTGNCYNLLFHDVECGSNGGAGFYINGSAFDNCNISNGAFKRNYTYGINVNSNANMFVLNASNVDANANTGVLCQGARGMLTNNTLQNNGDAGLDASGDDTLVGGNIGFNNFEGARVAGDRNIIFGSSFTDNELNCGHIMTGALTTIVMACHWDGAGNTTLDDEGSQTFTDGSLP